VQILDSSGIAVDATLGDEQFAQRGRHRIPIHGGDPDDGTTNVDGTNPGDLKTVQIEFHDGTWKSRPDTLQYYAYYKQSNSTYSQGMLKSVIGPESLHRMKTETGKDPVLDGPLPAYSDLWIDYFTDDASETRERVARLERLAGYRR
jgi:hypothetical protein